MKDWIKEFLLIKPAEQRALITLCIVLLCSIFFCYVVPNYIPESKEQIQITPIAVAAIDTQTHKSYNTTNIKAYATNHKWHLHSFNANSVSYPELVAMGFSKSQAYAWYKTRNEIGGYKSLYDLKKIAGINDSIIAQLQPYVSWNEIPKQTNAAQTKQSAMPKHKIRIDINTADTTQLKTLPMIGSKRAALIVKYRNILGGFISVQQLKEVYGINDTIFDAIEKQCYIEGGFTPQKIAINLSSEQALYKHPYIKANAKLIVAYRREHGAFENATQLYAIHGIEKEAIQKMLPYIQFDIGP